MYNSNTYIRTLYAPGFSFLMMSFFRTNLTLNFVPYLGKDNIGRSQYSKTEFLSTTVNYEGAAAIYLTAMPILDGNENQVELVLPCSNNATLIFEYKPDQNNQMSVNLFIKKNNKTIPFRFGTIQCLVKENGQMVTKIIQSGLGAFVKTLEAYLSAIGSDLHLNKLSEEEFNNQEMPVQTRNNAQF